MYNKAINAYQKDSLKQQLSSADPHKITLMLMSGALDRLAYAKGAIERGDMSQKSHFVSKATAIIINLRDTIDLKVSPDFSQSLFGLYNYMVECVNDASISNDISGIDETISLLTPIRDAWASIPRQEIEKAYQLQTPEVVNQ